MSNSTIIDQSTFEALKESMGDDFINELVQAYFDETPQLLSKLHDALNRNDFQAFRQAAHSIKSTSNSFGALQFGELARELEFMGRDSNLDGAADKVQKLENDYALVRKSLQEACNV